MKTNIDYEKLYPLMYKYNEYFKRFNKGLRWFDDPGIKHEDKLKQEENFSKVIKILGDLSEQIMELGHKITSIEANMGFDLIEISKKIDVSKHGLQVDLIDNKK